MKRRLSHDIYGSCEQCGEVSYTEDLLTNQQFDQICITCHSTIYTECPTCDGYLLDADEECRSAEHCSCISCTDKLENHALKCVGCNDLVIKPRDDLTFAIVDVCYPCLRTRCLGCFKVARNVVCLDCRQLQPEFHILMELIGTRDIVNIISDFLLPNTREIILNYPNIDMLNMIYGRNLLNDAKLLHNEQ